MANAIFSLPLASGGSQRSRCGTLPYLAISSPQIALDTSSSSSGQPSARRLLHDDRQLREPGAATAVLGRAY